LRILKGRKSSLKIFIFFTAGVLFIPWALAQAPRAPQSADQKASGPLKVALLPITIYSPENLEYLREGTYAMFSSRVELEGRISVLERGAVKKALAEVPGEIDSESARKLGETLGADYVVYGSLTKLGNTASVDLKVLEVKGVKPASSVYVQANKLEEIIAQVDVLARKIDEKILGYPLSPPPAQKAAVAEKPAEAPKPMAAIPPPPPGLQPLTPAGPDRRVSAYGFWKSSPFSFKIVGMSMADLDGDGRNEVVLIDDRNLWIYRWENEFKLLKKFSGGKLNQYLAVDTGDIDKDGKAEIFVTSLEGDATETSARKLSSFVVTFREGDYRIIARNLPWYLRVVGWGEKGAVLLGQSRGYDVPFQAPIYEMGWNGKGYKELRKIEASKKVFSLYGFTPFFHEGKTYYAFIDSDFRLKVLDPKGSLIWRSPGAYGSGVSFQAKPLPTGSAVYYEGDDVAFVNVRVIARGDELLILRNTSPLGQFFKKQTYYTGGEVQSLVWNGAMFMETWRSVEIPGYLVDFQNQDLDGTPGKELVVAVNLPREGIFSGGSNSALMIGRLQ
jgi:TolB-like protein